MFKVAFAAGLLGVASAQDPEWVMPPTNEATGNICHLQYLHEPHATPIDLTGTQCSAWSDNSCCSAATAAAMDYDVADEDTGLYDGHGLGISQCGIPSRACQKWFIAESCLYECDVNAGRYRHHVGDAACEEDNNKWQMSGFPLKVLRLSQSGADSMLCPRRAHTRTHAHAHAARPCRFRTWLLV